ncbi:hypothetical protein AB1N83_014385, partial [Pleurotus pulmonarius]
MTRLVNTPQPTQTTQPSAHHPNQHNQYLRKSLRNSTRAPPSTHRA